MIYLCVQFALLYFLCIYKSVITGFETKVADNFYYVQLFDIICCYL